MSNRFTAVPDAPVPPLGRIASAAVPVADAVMWILWSRPATGSLRRTWVTPATTWLTALVALLAAAAALVFLVAAAGGPGPGRIAAAVLCTLAALAAAAIAIVGAGQRRAR